MKIREWTLEEAKTDRLFQFLKAFENDSEFVRGDIEYARKKYYDMMVDGSAVILIAEKDNKIVGAIGFIVAPDLYKENSLLAIETFWYVTPEYRGGMIGIRLIKAFERYAENLGCNRVALIHMSDSYPDMLRKLYIKFGYKLTELHYIKELEK